MLHPQIFNLGKYIKSKNMFANLSTREWRLLKFPAIEKELKCFNSIGVSVNDPFEYREILSELRMHYTYGNKKMSSYLGVDLIHFVPFNMQYLSLMLKTAKDPVLLLHPKNAGRGQNYYVELDYQRVWEEIQKAKVSISVDTIFAEKLEPFWDVNPKLYYTEDGIHSKYIDAVNLEVGSSSYSDKTYSFKGRFGVDEEKLAELLVKEL
jgi:hypothetical protein